MNKKKNETRLCWSCEADVSFNEAKCPFCGVDLEAISSSPEKTPEKEPMKVVSDPAFSVTKEEWNVALEKEVEKPEPLKNEMISLLLLLPGVVFFLFGLALLFFAEGGVLHLKWKADFAYFYFIGSLPLLFLGWRLLKKTS